MKKKEVITYKMQLVRQGKSDTFLFKPTTLGLVVRVATKMSGSFEAYLLAITAI